MQNRGPSRPLSRQEQFRCAEKAIKGNGPENLQARRRLVESMTGLIVQTSKEYGIHYSQLDDVVQECYSILLALFSPADQNTPTKARFDPSFKVKPSTYAIFWIRSAIQQFREKDRTIRIPRNIDYLYSRFNKFVSGSENLPSGKELETFIAETNPKKNAYAQRLRDASTAKVVSLDRTLNEEEENTFLDLIEDESVRIPERRIMIKIVLNRAMQAVLTEREAQYIKLKYEKDWTIRQIAEKFGISGSRVGQIIHRAQKKIEQWILERYPNIKNESPEG